MDNLEQFIKTAAYNNIEVEYFDEGRQELDAIGFDGSNYFKKGNISVIKALSANANEANVAVDASDSDKLSSIIDSDYVIFLIEKETVFKDLYESYLYAKRAVKSNYILFISQESKTADIEKQLVSGVQAAKKIKFVLV